MVTDMGNMEDEVQAQRPALRIGLLVAGGASAVAGGALVIEELTDLLRGRADLDETFGALVAIAIGLMLLSAGALLGDGPRRLGTRFWLATGGIASVAAAAAFGLGLLVDLGTAGARRRRGVAARGAGRRGTPRRGHRPPLGARRRSGRRNGAGRRRGGRGARRRCRIRRGGPSVGVDARRLRHEVAQVAAGPVRGPAATACQAPGVVAGAVSGPRTSAMRCAASSG